MNLFGYYSGKVNINREGETKPFLPQPYLSMRAFGSGAAHVFNFDTGTSVDYEGKFKCFHELDDSSMIYSDFEAVGFDLRSSLERFGVNK
jgi:hypothetical protein